MREKWILQLKAIKVYAVHKNPRIFLVAYMYIM
jgi:hypothetical protein